jgi:hypothetical protein
MGAQLIDAQVDGCPVYGCPINGCPIYGCPFDGGYHIDVYTAHGLYVSLLGKNYL